MILLTDEEIQGVYEQFGKLWYDGVQRDINRAIAKAQLKKVVEWGIDRRKHFEQKRDALKLEKPNDISGITILGAKIKAFQQVIDKCRQSLLEEVK